MADIPFIDYSARFQPEQQPSLGEIFNQVRTNQDNAQINEFNFLKALGEQQKQIQEQNAFQRYKANPNDRKAQEELAFLNPQAYKALTENTAYNNQLAINTIRDFNKKGIDQKRADYQRMLPQLAAYMGTDANSLPQEYGTVAQSILNDFYNQRRSLEDELGVQKTQADIASTNAHTNLYNQQAQTEPIQRLKLLADAQKAQKEGQGATNEKASNLRKELNQRLGNYIDVRDAYDNIVTSAQNPSAAGDMSLIFSYMKLLDPGSTVREGEYAAAEQARGVPAGIINAYNKALEGQLLAKSQRQDFVNRANSLYRVAEKNAQKTINQYKGIAQRAGLNPEDVLIDFASTSNPNLKESSNQNITNHQTSTGVRFQVIGGK